MATLRRITTLSSSSAPDFWVLKTTDTLEMIVASGYFAQFSGKPHPGDLVFAFGLDGTAILEVTGSTPGFPLLTSRFSSTDSAVLLPTPSIPSFSVDTSSITQTTIDFTAGNSSTGTGEDVLAAIVYGTDKATLMSDVTLAASGTITGLTPGAVYTGVRLKVWVESDPSRVTYSAVVADFTMATYGTISPFSFTAAEDTKNVIIHEFTVSDARYDEWSYNLTGAVIDENSTWDSLPTVDTDYVTLPEYGTRTVYARARDASNPTDMTPVASATATATRTSGNAPTFRLQTSELYFSEDGMPIVDVTVLREDDLTAANNISYYTQDGTDGEAAIDDTHYKNAAGTLSFAINDTSKTIQIQLLFNNLGHNNGVPIKKWFNIIIWSDTYSVAGGTSETGTIWVLGIHKVLADGTRVGGYHANGQIDVRKPPVDLPIVSGLNTLSANGSYSLKHYKADNLTNHNVTIADQISGDALEVWDCVFEGGINGAITNTLKTYSAKFINCAFRNWNANLTPSNTVVAIGAFKSGLDVWKGGIEILGCNAQGPGKFFELDYGRGLCRIVSNFFINTTNFFPDSYNKLITNVNDILSERDGTLAMFWDSPCSGGEGQEVRKNVVHTPNTDHRKGCVQDIVAFGVKAGYSESARSFVEENFILCAGGTRDVYVGVDGFWGSNFGIQTGDINTVYNYITVQHNYLTGGSNGGISLNGLETVTTPGNLGRHNHVYMPASLDGSYSTENTVGIAAGRTTNRVEWNKVYAYQSNGITSTSRSDYWVYATAPIGWNNRIDSSDFAANGENLFNNRHIILNDPAREDGVACQYAEYNTPSGTGIMYYDDTAGTLAFAAYGEGYGNPVDIASASGVTGAGDWDWAYDLESSDSLGIHVAVDPTTLLALGEDVYWPVYVTGAKVTEYQACPWDQDYDPDSTQASIWCGEWQGSNRTTGSGGTPSIPIPTGLGLTVVSGSEIDLDWDDMSVDSYVIQRSLDGSTWTNYDTSLTNSYDDTGCSEGVTYYYRVASVDGGVQSAFCVYQADTASPPASEYVVGGEFNIVTDDTDFETDYPGWHKATNVSVTVSGGKLTAVNNDTTYSRQLYYIYDNPGVPLFDITGATLYRFQMLMSYISGGTGLEVDIDSADTAYGGAWKNGDILTNFGVTLNVPRDLSTWNPTTWTQNDLLCLVIWLEKGKTYTFDYCRIVEDT